jgi:hypothetical protein
MGSLLPPPAIDVQKKIRERDEMDKAREQRHAYRMDSQPFDLRQAVSLVTFTIRLTPLMRQQLSCRPHQTYASGLLHLVKRHYALRSIADELIASLQA